MARLSNETKIFGVNLLEFTRTLDVKRRVADAFSALAVLVFDGEAPARRVVPFVGRGAVVLVGEGAASVLFRRGTSARVPSPRVMVARRCARVVLARRASPRSSGVLLSGATALHSRAAARARCEARPCRV